MRFVGLPRVLVAIVSSLTVADCTPPAVTRPIGIRAGGTVYHVSCRAEVDCNAEIARTCTAGHFITASGGTALGRSTKHPYGLEFVCRPSKLLAADYVATQPAIQILITPECKDMFYGPDFLDRDANGNAVSTEKRPKPDYVPWDPGRAIPMSYKDPKTSITFYVESDGRHLVAIDSIGKLLWVRNPWEDSGAFCQYRTPRPVIDSLKQTELTEIDRANLKPRGANLVHKFIALQFDSSQYGVVDESTGDFIPEGQN
jgi:hypothetical protein